MLISAATGSERVLVPGTGVVLEVVRMAENEQFPGLMRTLYPGSMVPETDVVMKVVRMTVNEKIRV